MLLAGVSSSASSGYRVAVGAGQNSVARLGGGWLAWQRRVLPREGRMPAMKSYADRRPDAAAPLPPVLL